MQTDDAEDFKRRSTEAIAIYQEIEQEGLSDALMLGATAQAHRLRLKSMLSPEISGRRALLDEALSVQRRVVEDLQPKGGLAWMRASNFQLLLLRDRFLLDSGESRIALLREALNLSEQLTGRSTSPLEIDDRGEAFSFRLFFTAHASIVLKEWSNEFDQAHILGEALTLVRKTQDHRVLAALHTQLADSIAQGLAKDERELKEQIARALQTSRITGDRSLIGQALAQATSMVRWQLVAERDEEQARVWCREMRELFEEGRQSLHHLLDSPSQYFLPFLYADLGLSHCIYATNFETDRNPRKRLIEEAVALFREGSPIARRIDGFPMVYLGYVGAEALRNQASLEDDGQRRQELLTEAITITETCVTLIMKVMPIGLWNIGMQYVAEGSLRSDLAQQIEDPVKKKEMLVTSVDRLRVGLTNLKSPTAWAYPGKILRIGQFNFRLANVLSNLFELTDDYTLVNEQLQALDEAKEAYTKGQSPARVAEALWQKARIRSQIGQHNEAAEDFSLSAESYQSASNKTPSLKELYADLSLYMLAWSQIESARAAHSHGAYGKASEAYARASSLLKSTQRWPPLGEHYVGCAALEEAEALSHEENPGLSGPAFAKAAQFFESSMTAIASWVPQILTGAETKEKARWETITAGRNRYCHTRADLEDAKVLDRRGEHASSAEKFAAVAAVLEDLSKEEEIAEGKREMNTLALICRAWQSMKEAEAGSSADKYGEAAQRFEQAAETTANPKVRGMALANAAYSYALQTGTSLRLTRETELYSKTKKYLETAADYYTEVGMDRASSWTRATERIFDGLVYLARAEGELEAPAKSEFYDLAGRSFEVAARFYDEAGYTAKQEQSNRYLQYAREQKLVFISPAEAIDGSIVLRQPEAQVSPGLTRDQPLGIEGFENANVQVSLVADRSEISRGESVNVVVEMVSAGRFPAILVKMTGLASAGLEVETVGEKYRIEDGTLALKGHRLEPFETLDLRLRLKPTVAGEFTLQPRILYLDQSGQYRHSLPRSIMFGVRAGESTAVTSLPLPELKASARAVFDYLVKAFIEDYMRKKLQYEQAGWRSLSEAAASTNISRSTLYGKAGKYGQALTELMTRGLVESRIQTGHRGRGGEAVKVRIAYDKDPVKRYVERTVIGSK